jgi:hypothetical protein
MSGSIASASYANNATSASYANNATSASYALNATTGAYANTATSASYALNATTFNGLASSIFATTGSNTFIGTQTITGSVLQSGSFTTTGTIIAQTINVQQVTSSIVYSCGSNIFGTNISNTQQLTGSVGITGSLTIVGASSATSYNGATIFGSTIACSPIGCFATSCATSFIGGTMSGTTIYGSTAVCSAVGKFTSCIDAGSGNFSSTINAATGITIGTSGTNDISWGTAGGIKLSRTNIGAEYALSQAWTGVCAYIDIGSSCQWNGGVRILPNGGGNVGIGTNSPNFKTHISTGDTTSITQPTAGTYGLYIQQNSSGNVGGLYIQDGASNSGNSIFVGDNNGAVRFVVNTDGNIGIGISSPSSILDVQSAASIIKLKSTTGTNSVYTNYENCSNFYVGTDSAAGGSFGKACAAVLWQVSCNSIVFATSNTEQMRITGGGNIGINCSAPSYKLHVGGTIGGYFAADGDNIASFINTASTYTYGVGGVFIGSSTANNCTNLSGGSGALIIRNGASTYTAAIAYNGQAYFCGNVGIGITTPKSKLHVSSTSNFEAILKISDITTESTGILALGDGGTSTINVGVWRAAANSMSSYGNWLNLGGYDGILFATCALGIGSQAERMRITSGGNVGIGAISPMALLHVCKGDISLELGAGDSCKLFFTADHAAHYIMANGYWIDVVGNANEVFRVWKGSTSTPSNEVLRVTGAGITCFGYTVCAPCFATISDYRMKYDILPITNGLGLIGQIKPYSFKLTYDCQTSFGMIAHELQEIIPEAVFGQKDGEVMQGVDYMKLLPITIKAIQEQQCTICTQASMINTLKTCLGII